MKTGAVVGWVPVTRRALTRSDLIWFYLVPAITVMALLVTVLFTIDREFVSTLNFSNIYIYRYALLQGLYNTLLITFLSLLLGISIGLSLACLSYYPSRPLRWFILAYVEIMRDVPLVVALFWIHFALPLITGYSTSVFQSGFIAMALQSSAYLSDVARAGIQAIPAGQWDAADALGLTTMSKWADIILPQTLKIMVPPLANVSIGYFKASSALALLSVGELMTVGARISSYSFKPIETLTTVGIIYLGLGYMLSSVTHKLERLVKT